MKTLAIAACSAIALIAAPAFAADFTIDVPVTFEATPSVTGARVSCFISIQPVGGPGVAAGSNVIARGSTEVPITDGAFRGTVTVEMDARGLHPASEAKSYGCSIDFRGTSRGTISYAASPGNAKEAYEGSTGMHLDRVVTSVQGNLP